ncbi:hypothetical protein K2X85_08525 [bacterium]|nr:hypothetical protein [bacterium]
MLAAKPPGALGVIQARKDAKDKEDIVVEGRIGGDPKPFVDGIAAFSIVDMELKPCATEEGCPTPWDYCCDLDKLPERKALVKVVDGSGKPMASDARQLLGVKELSTVTVRGKASRDEAGNLTILASGIFVEAN